MSGVSWFAKGNGELNRQCNNNMSVPSSPKWLAEFSVLRGKDVRHESNAPCSYRSSVMGLHTRQIQSRVMIRHMKGKEPRKQLRHCE